MNHFAWFKRGEDSNQRYDPLHQHTFFSFYNEKKSIFGNNLIKIYYVVKIVNF